MLVVMGILVLLIAIVVVAINPARQFAMARNTSRASNVTQILNAIDQNMTENAGKLPVSITTTAQYISNTGADLCSLLVPTYLSALPVDPLAASTAPIGTCGGAYNTNFQVFKDSSNRVTVLAPFSELNVATISATR